MSSDEFSPDPSAISYYERLDVPTNARKKTIRRAGKLASRRYHPDSDNAEASQENFIQMKNARETLLDDQTRSEYALFCQKLGMKEGTYGFEKWERKGRPAPPEEWIESEFDQDSDDDLDIDYDDFDTSTGPDWEQDTDTRQEDNRTEKQQDTSGDDVRDIRIFQSRDGGEFQISRDDAKELHKALDDPEVVWDNLDDSKNVTVNFWTGSPKARLYVNSFFDEDFYINLHTGKILTESGGSPHIQISYASGLDAIFISDHNSDKSIKIDISDSRGRNRDGNQYKRNLRDARRKTRKERRQNKTDDDDTNDKGKSQWEHQKQQERDKERLKNRNGNDRSGNNREWSRSDKKTDDGWNTEKLDHFEEDEEEDPFEELKFWQNTSLFSSFSTGSLLSWSENAIVKWVLTPYYLIASFIPKSRVGRGLLFLVWLALFPTPFDGLSLRSAFAILVAVPFPSFGPYALAILVLYMMFLSYPMAATIQVMIGFLVSLPILYISKEISE